jgi:hypothetical protein
MDSNPFGSDSSAFNDPSVERASNDYAPPSTNAYSSPGGYGVADSDALLRDLNISDEPTRPASSNQGAYGGGGLLAEDPAIDAKEEALRKREQEIIEREAMLAKREQQVNVGGPSNGYQPAPNWPSRCYPILYHSINQEIPEQSRMLCRKFYACLLFTWLTLAFNWVTWFIIWVSGADTSDAGSAVLWGFLYIALGGWGSLKGWYMPMYSTLKEGSSAKWCIFGITFFAHVIFTGFMALGFPGMAGAGWLTMIEVFAAQAPGTGLIVLGCAATWTLLFLISVYLGKQAQALWAGKGGAEQMQRDAATLAVTSGAASAVASAAISSKTNST